MKVKLLTLVSLLWFVEICASTWALGQTKETFQLPNDLLFTTGKSTADPWQMNRHNTLIRIDKDTLGAKAFYIDESAYQVRAVSWSPDGKLLAIWVLRDRAYYCLLKSSGALYLCFDEQVHPSDTWPRVTWSADNQRVYFLTDILNENPMRRKLVEADVITGHTLRVIFDDYSSSITLSWTRQLDYVALNLGLDSELDFPRTLIQMNTQKKMDLRTAIPTPTYFWGSCPDFSPKGTFVVLVGREDKPNETPALRRLLFLVDKQGRIADTIEWGYCPTWEPSEEALYYIGLNGDIYRYSLIDHTSVLFAKGEDFRVDKSSFHLSPKDGYLVGDNHDGQVIVYSPDGKAHTVHAPYAYGFHPLWVPNEVP